MASSLRAFERRLIGTWKSDRQRTFANHKFGPKVTPAAARRFKSTFGRFNVRWTRSRVYSWFEGDEPTHEKYEIAAADHQSVVVETKSAIHGEKELRYIVFEADGYWIMGSVIPEFFRKVPAVSSVRRRSPSPRR